MDGWSRVGKNSDNVPLPTSPGRSRIVLSCQLDKDDQPCSWKGPKGQVLKSGDPQNPKYQYKAEIKGRFCRMSFTFVKYEDEGIWECTREGDTSPKIAWNVSVRVRPKNPVLSYSNGTAVSDNVTFISQVPIELFFNCSSIKGRPVHESVSFLINGAPAIKSSTVTSGPTEELFDSSAATTLTLTKDQPAANVTCVVKHLTGQTVLTKLFGVKSSDNTILLQEEISQTDPKTKRLKCVTYMFPWPSNYEIVKIQPDQTVKSTEKEVNIAESGSYMCRAKLPSDDWLESKTIEVKAAVETTTTIRPTTTAAVETTTTIRPTTTEAAVETTTIRATTTGIPSTSSSTSTVTPQSTTSKLPLKQVTEAAKEKSTADDRTLPPPLPMERSPTRKPPQYSIHYAQNGENSGNVLSAEIGFAASILAAAVTLVVMRG